MQVASERAMALELPWFSAMGTSYRTQKGIPFFDRYLRTELIIHHLAVSFGAIIDFFFQLLYYQASCESYSIVW